MSTIFLASKGMAYAARASVGRAVGRVATAAQVVPTSAAGAPFSRMVHHAGHLDSPRAYQPVSVIGQAYKEVERG